MAPKEDLNLPEGEQAEAKDTEPSVEAAEPVASSNREEDHGASTAEINLVTEKGATSMEEASTSETRNIAAEISALLDAPEEADEVFNAEEDVSAVTLRKRLTKGISEEENPERRDSCFLTEIDENADDEVFNAEDVVRNIDSIDNFLLNQDKASEQKVGMENEEVDETETLGMIEDEDKSITIDNTEEEEKQPEEVHTPASIVDTILAAARSASVEQTKEEEQDPSIDNEETDLSAEKEENTEKLEETVAQDSETVDHKEKVVPAELMEAAHSIVDSVLEKAKAIVIEKTAQNTAPESRVEIIVSKSPEQDISDTPVTEALDSACEEIKEQDVIVEVTEPQEMSAVAESTEPEIENLGSMEKTIEAQTTEDAQLEEPIEDAQLAEPIEDSPATEEKTEAPTPIIVINQDSVEIEEIINFSPEEEIHEAIEEPMPIEDSHPIENQTVPDLVEDLAVKTEKVENQDRTTDEFVAAQTDPTENICEEITGHSVLEQASNTPEYIEEVGNIEKSEELKESHVEAKDFMDDIKKEFNDVFVDAKSLENDETTVTSTSAKLYSALNTLPLGELSLATLVIFLALIMFNY